MHTLHRHCRRALLPLALLGLILGAAGGCKQSLLDDSTMEKYDAAEMDAAIATARARVDEFLTAYEAQDGMDFAVKVSVQDGDYTEHFWMQVSRYSDGVFHGTIDNHPDKVKTVTYGQSWTIAKADISDWTYLKDGKMHGSFTLIPLLPTLNADEATLLKSMMVEQ